MLVVRLRRSPPSEHGVGDDPKDLHRRSWRGGLASPSQVPANTRLLRERLSDPAPDGPGFSGPKTYPVAAPDDSLRTVVFFSKDQ